MSRARKPCNTKDCPNLQPCADHPPAKAWADSRRRDLTDSRYRGAKGVRRSRAILDRDDTCHVCGLLGADQVDHVIPLAEGGADTRDNLAPIHRVPCHRDKTAAEAARARAL